MNKSEDNGALIDFMFKQSEYRHIYKVVSNKKRRTNYGIEIWAHYFYLVETLLTCAIYIIIIIIFGNSIRHASVLLRLQLQPHTPCPSLVCVFYVEDM